jgi:hypothetical protein
MIPVKIGSRSRCNGNLQTALPCYVRSRTSMNRVVRVMLWQALW